MMKYAVAAGLILLATVPLAAEDLSDIADRVQASAVTISAEKTDATAPAQPTGDKDQDDAAAKSTQRQGSGMIFSADGYIVTATGLVENVGKITITLSDGRQMPAQIIGRDPRTGIALLKASGASGLTPIVLGDSKLARRGNSVFSIGNAYTLPGSLSSGVIAAVRRSGGALPHLMLQTDSYVYPGSTGAPLFSMKGEVIGMYTSNYSNVGKRTGIGLAVTSNIIKDVVEKLQKSGAIDRGWLGVQVRKKTDQEASADSIEKGSGLVVVKTFDGGPAAGAGIQPGDVIEMVNGKVMRDIVPFAWEIADHPSGAEVTLDIVHNTSRKDVRVKLAHMPDSSTSVSSTSSGPSAADKNSTCLRYVPSVGITIPVACDE